MQFPYFQLGNRDRKLRGRSELSYAQMYEHLVNSVIIFMVIVTLHTIAMMIFEKLPFRDALWLTFSTITTVGYGDFSAQTNWGRLSTIVLIYIGGIALLAKIFAEYMDFRMEKRDRQIKGLWEWTEMKNHILIINTPEQHAEKYLLRLVEEIKHTPGLANLPMQILSHHFSEGLPHAIRNESIVHFHGKAELADHLQRVNVEHAKYIVLIARDDSDAVSDSINFDILNRIKDISTTAYILCEVVDDRNRQRFKNHGADSVIRPDRTYPEILTRALEAPGTEQVLENLFTHEAEYPQRFEVVIRNMKWSLVASNIITADIGIPLAYIDEEKKVHTNPRANAQIHADALIILVSEENNVTNEQVQRAIESH